MSSIFSKLDPAGQSMVSPDYAFTEISTFEFVQPVDNIFTLPAEQYFKDCINVFLTFRFPTTFDPAAIEHSGYFSDPQPKQCIWDSLWQALSRAALQSEGGWITSGSVSGWYVDDSSSDDSEGRQARYFVGVFRFLNVETAHSFFGPVQDDERDSRAGGLLARLRDMAGTGFEIEFVKMVDRQSSEPPFVATNNPFTVGGAF
ncbi:hypothetical protein DV737_g3807, partial [Chaetothyriales sp. CBS 132003]